MKFVKTSMVLLCIVAGSLAGGALVMRTKPGLASRDGAGNYTLPAGSLNPAVAGTPIKSADMNTTLNDLKTEMTDSLSRSGKGGMSAKLTVSLPGSAGNDVATLFEPSLANGNALAIRLGKANTGASDGVGYYYVPNATAANSKGCLAISGQTDTLCVDGNGKTIFGGGTGISASYRGTTSWTPGSITQNQCVTTTISLTGAAAGADCNVTAPSGTPVASVWYACSVTANTCNIYDCNADQASAHTGPIGTYACRVFNP